MPPTGSDFASAFNHNYKAGIISCHNGDTWYIEAGYAKIDTRNFDTRYGEGIDRGLTPEQSIERCIEHFSQTSRGIKCVKL